MPGKLLPLCARCWRRANGTIRASANARESPEPLQNSTANGLAVSSRLTRPSGGRRPDPYPVTGSERIRRIINHLISASKPGIHFYRRAEIGADMDRLHRHFAVFAD